MNLFHEYFDLVGLSKRARRAWLRERRGFLHGGGVDRVVHQGFFSGFGNRMFLMGEVSSTPRRIRNL